MNPVILERPFPTFMILRERTKGRKRRGCEGEKEGKQEKKENIKEEREGKKKKEGEKKKNQAAEELGLLSPLAPRLPRFWSISQLVLERGFGLSEN